MKVKPNEHSCSGSEELGQSVGFRPVCDFPLDRLDILKDLLNSALLTLWMMWNSSGMQQSWSTITFVKKCRLAPWRALCSPLQPRAVPPFPSSGFELCTWISLCRLKGASAVDACFYCLFLCLILNTVSLADFHRIWSRHVPQISAESHVCFLFWAGKTWCPCSRLPWMQMFLGLCVFLGRLSGWLVRICVLWKQKMSVHHFCNPGKNLWILLQYFVISVWMVELWPRSACCCWWFLSPAEM